MEDIIGDIDPDAARKAFEQLLPRLDAMDEVRALSTDIRKALIHGAAIGRLVLEPARYAAFQSLPADRFDMQHVDLLLPAAQATWHAWLSLRAALVESTAAKVPEPLRAQAEVVKERMLTVLGYVVGRLPNVRDHLDDIRDGKGHIDLADDLQRLADLYKVHATALAEDRILYRATDEAEARTLAQGIYKVLGDGRSSDAHHWAEYQGRAWTFLLETYDEVAAAGSWLFRHEDGAELFPSLYTVGRQRRGRRDDGTELPGEELPGEELPGDPVPPTA